MTVGQSDCSGSEVLIGGVYSGDSDVVSWESWWLLGSFVEASRDAVPSTAGYEHASEAIQVNDPE